MRRLILFLVLALALIVGLNIVSRVFDDGRQIDAMNALLDETSGKEAIIVGSSVGGAIRFDTLCLDGADFFFVIQDVFETQAMVELVLSRPDPPKKWFLALSPGATLYNNAVPASGRSHNRRTPRKRRSPFPRATRYRQARQVGSWRESRSSCPGW